MRWRLLILAAAAPLLLGCQLKERRLPAARLEIEVRPEVAQSAVTFDFARTRSSGGVLYGHKASFIATEKIQRVAFERTQRGPETWSLTWEEVATDARHSISVAVRSRGKAPELEIQAASGRSLGTHLGPAVQLYLLPGGSVTTQPPGRPAPRRD